MKLITHRRTAAFRIILIMILCLSATSLAAAAPFDTVNAPITKDAFVGLSGGFVDNNLLIVGRDFSAPNIYAILTFNVAALPVAIEQARLNLYTVGSCNTGNNVAVSVWGLDDSFDTWTSPTFADVLTAKQSATSLASAPDEGTVNGAVKDYFHWTGGVGSTMASWLNTQRTAGANPGVATLLLQMEGAAPGTVSFEDSSGNRCPGDSGVPPVLQLSGNSQPLVVTMTDSPSAKSVSTWPLYAGLGAVALILIAGLAISRRRTA